MHGYDLTAWAGFFTAVTGAAAALAGLLFVAVSINLESIVKGKNLAPRAAETLAMLVFVVVSAGLALVPQDIEALGGEILVLVIPLSLVIAWNQVPFWRERPDVRLAWILSRLSGGPEGHW
jgi:modulator of FtsH protease